MKKLLFIALCMFFSQYFVQAQDSIPSSKEIEMKIKLLGYRFYQDGERITWKQLVSATESVNEANKLLKRAKWQNLLSNILAFSGGALIGIPLGQQSADREPTWELAYIGGAIAAVSIHLSFRAFNNANKGVDSYNLAVKSTADNRFQPEFQIVANGNGLGFAMKF
ncbi:hypothetical protein ACOKFD_09185 [Flagellimonas sp. S174]|uniref:hypothetical protein n=1 Tax=Flagellimonas sp. S174 TaxID=3410790 RepID=UPI003BF5E149